MNNFPSAEDMRGDSRWSCRASCMTRGCVPKMKKGQHVWVWFCGAWQHVTVRRRMAGGVYLCDLPRPVEGSRTVVACAPTFGGFVDDGQENPL